MKLPYLKRCACGMPHTQIDEYVEWPDMGLLFQCHRPGCNSSLLIPYSKLGGEFGSRVKNTKSNVYRADERSQRQDTRGD